MTTRRFGQIWVFALAPMALAAAAATTAWGDEPPVDFGRKIRPLLADKCFACHGLDAKSRKSDLRLDTREGLFGALESGETLIVPGDSAGSSLYQRLASRDDDIRMPPPKSEKQLTSEEIETIRRWIDQGAKWQEHWSLVAPARPSPPEISAKAWVRTPIDAFIAARLERESLHPAAEADRTSLLRRATYDLTGLPPTPQEMDDFLCDQSLDAYEKLVDRLLASPHYGEHMARYWLDAARFGDTHGLHLDNFREMWPYRDWVVRAFNQNMPFDRFTIEQLAGDLLPNSTLEQQIATGFNRCNVTTSEGGALPEEYEVYYANDRVATMSTVFMGVSMGCVICHDHKFDPFQMKDFYQLSAFFNSLDGPVMDGNAKNTAPVVKLMTEPQRVELTSADRRIGEIETLAATPIASVDQAQADWESMLRGVAGDEPQWHVIEPLSSVSRGNAILTRQSDQSLLASGENPITEMYEFTALAPGGALTAIRLEALIDPSLPDGGAGRSVNGNAVLSEFEADWASAGAPDQWQRVVFSLAWADHEQTDGDFKIANAIDGNVNTGWAIGGHQKRENRTAIFVGQAPFAHEPGARLRIRLRHESAFPQHQFGRVRLAVTAARSLPQIANRLPSEIAAILNAAPEQRSADQQRQLREHYRGAVSMDPMVRAARDELNLLRKRRAELDNSLPTTLVWRDSATPKQAFILLRGAYDKRGDPVARNTPAALPPLAVPAGEIPTRLHLAKWLVSAEHPLVARVTVNRFWQQYFGIGLVETAEDFGSQGTPPSHPELLDWLAVEFRESGWDVKRLQKLIVLSAAYRQSSRNTPELVAKDPKNRLLARGPRFRLDAEAIRDTALAASGLLVRTVGGPSVKPYQPPGIWEAVGYTDSNTKNFQRDSGQSLYRRSLYTFWKRTAPPPTMAIFDAPSRETCAPRRGRTNTPLAALALLNDEQFVEASRHLAQRLLREGGATDAERASYAFRLATARAPSERELTIVLALHQQNLARFQADRLAANQLLSVGETKPDAALEPADLAAWTVVANLLLNLDETITKG